jgi:transposase
MRQQHTIGGQQKGDQEQGQGILVPLDLPEFKMVSQSQQADGSLEVHVIAIKDCDPCPTCQCVSGKIHDIRKSIKRDSRLRPYQVRLVLYKRRFRCPILS